ncbi:MAG: hypothetical protein ACYDBH_23175 [Acidobacteriaceae bacterium]
MKMNHLRSYVLGIAAVLISVPVHAATQNQQQPATLYSANAQLTQSLKSSSAKVGQAVTAKLTSDLKTSDSTELPKGAMLMGKVEQVQSANGGSTVSIVFNEARLRNGREIPIKAMLLGAYPPVPYYSAGGSSSYLPIQPRTVPDDRSILQEPGTLRHITLRSSAKSSESGVFTSKNHSFKLDSGTRLQVAIALDGPLSATTSGE